MNVVPPWPGTAGPATGTPVRAAGSARRTSTVDALRPDGAAGPLVLLGRARDLRTGVDGRADVVAEARSRVTVDFTGRRTVTDIECDPPIPGLRALLGVKAGSGFRSALEAVAGELTARGGLLGLLLDEVPVATLISGAALARPKTGGTREAAFPDPPPVPAQAATRPAPPRRRSPPLDVCAGWVTGGVMHGWVREGRFGSLGREPDAPVLEDPADPLSWHSVPAPPAGTIRRRRRLDVAPGDRPGVATVEGLFRDTYVGENAAEVVIHEYGMTGRIDLAAGTVLAVEAHPHVLPGPDCPLAAASAQRLVGRPLVGLREALRSELTGTSTCTHLTDQLRALADVHALVPLLPGD